MQFLNPIIGIFLNLHPDGVWSAMDIKYLHMSMFRIAVKGLISLMEE
jgi:hypothetical protein